jgi:hypothetical protein
MYMGMPYTRKMASALALAMEGTVGGPLAVMICDVAEISMAGYDAMVAVCGAVLRDYDGAVEHERRLFAAGVAPLALQGPEAVVDSFLTAMDKYNYDPLAPICQEAIKLIRFEHAARWELEAKTEYATRMLAYLDRLSMDERTANHRAAAELARMAAEGVAGA